MFILSKVIVFPVLPDAIVIIVLYILLMHTDKQLQTTLSMINTVTVTIWLCSLHLNNVGFLLFLCTYLHLLLPYTVIITIIVIYHVTSTSDIFWGYLIVNISCCCNPYRLLQIMLALLDTCPFDFQLHFIAKNDMLLFWLLESILDSLLLTR